MIQTSLSIIFAFENNTTKGINYLLQLIQYNQTCVKDHSPHLLIVTCITCIRAQKNNHPLDRYFSSSRTFVSCSIGILGLFYEYLNNKIKNTGE